MSDMITTPRSIDVITAEIQFFKVQTGASILEIGKRLIEAKEQLAHGEWLTWLDEQVYFSEATAQRFMRVSREYSNPSALTDLGMTKAITLLALPADEREAFAAETHTVNGETKTVAEMSTRELEKAIKERDEALAGKVAAEQARQVAEDRADRAVEEAEERAEKAEADAQKARSDAARFAGEKAALEREMEDLRNSEPAPAAETDQLMLEEIREDAAKKAKAEAEAVLKKKIDKAEAARVSAEAARAAAEKQLAKANEDRERERAAAEADKVALEKRLAVAGSDMTAVYKVHFEAAQASMNQLLGILVKVDDMALLHKLSGAAKVLCTTITQRVDARLAEVEAAGAAGESIPA